MDLQAVRGMHDLYGEVLHSWRAVEAVVHCLFADFGYEEIRTPALEKLEVFCQAVGSDTDIVQKQMYRFDSEGGESVVLRPEGTAGFIRAVVEHQLQRIPHKKKYYYYGPMFRHERPQKGRQRQFHQFGGEIINDPSPTADCDLIAFLHRLYQKLGVTEYQIEINSVGCRECRPHYRIKLVEYLAKHRGAICPTCQERFERAPMRVLDCKNPTCQQIAQGAPLILDSICIACKEHHQGLKASLTQLKIPYVENPRIVRGLDYYVRTAFEFTTQLLGAQNALCGGGRYDGLSDRFGAEPFTAVGFALGMERLMLLLENTGKLPRDYPIPAAVFIALGNKAFELMYPRAFELKVQGFWIEMDSDPNRSLKAQLKAADRFNSPLVVIMGEDELKAKKCLLKDMKKGTQVEVDWSHLTTAIKERMQLVS